MAGMRSSVKVRRPAQVLEAHGGFFSVVAASIRSIASATSTSSHPDVVGLHGRLLAQAAHEVAALRLEVEVFVDIDDHRPSLSISNSSWGGAKVKAVRRNGAQARAARRSAIAATSSPQAPAAFTMMGAVRIVPPAAIRQRSPAHPHRW